MKDFTAWEWSASLEDQAGSPEERIDGPLQRTDHGPDAPPLNQPTAGTWLPLTAGVAHEAIVVVRAAHCDPAAERTELDGADSRRNGMRRPHGTILRHAIRADHATVCV
jgi:hypothetical protein